MRRVRRVAEGHIFLSNFKTSSIQNKISVLHKFRMILRIFKNAEGPFSVPLFQTLRIFDNTEGFFQSPFSVPFFRPPYRGSFSARIFEPFLDP